MKPVRLEFCGVNSFSEPAEVDFSDLLEFGIFGIFGDTGSGKSTILDCIGFALYGDVFRLGQRSSSITDIINYKLDRAYVRYEFEIVFEGRRRIFRAEREVKRKNAVQSARVWERKDGALCALAEGVRESNALLARIIGLNQKDFEKCIALPQGEFAQFVKSERSDRVKLIARLFDLEMYGDRLKERARDRFKDLANEAQLIEVQLRQYAELTQAELGRRKAEIASLEGEEKKLAALLDGAKQREKRISALAERKAAAEKAAAVYQKLNARRGEADALEHELSRLERAAAVVALQEDFALSARRMQAAKETLASAEARLQKAKREEEVCASFDEEGAEAEIARLTELAARAADAEERAKRRAAAEKSLQKTVSEYEFEAKRFADFSYEAEREAIEKKLAELGEGDFVSFANAHSKEALFREEYGVFARELGDLTRKHPQIGEDSAPLIRKYTALSGGEAADYADLKRAYEARERARAAAQKELLDLETYRGKYDLHNQRLQQLQTEFRRLKEELKGYGADVPEGAPAAEIRKRLEERKREKREAAEKKRAAERARADAEVAYASASASGKAAAETYAETEKKLAAACLRGGFARAEEARSLVAKYGNAGGAEARLNAFRREFAAAEARMREFAGEDFSEAAGDAPERARAAVREAETRDRELGKVLALRRAEAERAEKDYAVKRELTKAYAQKQGEAELAERLKKLLDGNKFMEFVAEECLQNVAATASARLLGLTGGRYFLRYDGGFFVGDNFNGGASRGVYTLSGGETFLVSLSLALALSAEICAKSLRPIEFFFLDEGFGTLDEHLVDVVLDSLEKLKNEHFSIGIVSHVEELKHRIDKKLLVKKATEKHGSQIQAE